MDYSTCFSIGALMARVHNVTLNKKISRVDYDLKTLVKIPYTYAKQYFSEDLPEMKFLKAQG